MITEAIKKQDHFERLYITADFVQTLLSEITVNMEQEKHSFQNMLRVQNLKNKD